MSNFVDPSDCDDVRAALDVSLSRDELSDRVVLGRLFAGTAMSRILALLPDAADRAAPDAEHIKRAAILWTASLIAPRLPRISRERFEEYQAQYANVPSGAELQGRLQADAFTELALIPDLAQVSLMPTIATLGQGGRGDVRLSPLPDSPMVVQWADLPGG